jgi:uncharacterized membrane protein YeaQ/YmgE (transglycosylase-associated protein family)
MLGILWTIIIGFVVGGLARLIMPGKDAMGFLMTALLGMAGALVITLIGRFLGLVEPGSGAGFIWSIIGALLVLFVYRRMRAGKA